MFWYSPHALQVLGSPEHGFLIWTPVALLAIAGLLVLALTGHGDSRRIGGCALLMFTLQVYVSGAVDSWSVAGAFGQRRFVAVTVLLAIGLAVLLGQTRQTTARVACAIAVAVCVWWNLGLTAAFGIGLMNRQRLELARNAYDVFVTIPRMAPALAARYLTNRESLYQTKG
jgi:phosphotransferase system  glucose/maltose/N-acetylglucosamine-specific IIC component